MHPVMNDIGSYAAAVLGVVPTNSAAAVTKGDAIDRIDAQSGVLVLQTGAKSGAPDSFTADCKLQHSDTTTDGDFSDFQIDETTVAVDQIITENETHSVNVDLSSAKRYIRAVATVAFVAGTSPKLVVAAPIVLGGFRELPPS
jgi:hypothetical protein